MKPTFTKRQRPTAPVHTIAEVRKAVGLFDDDTFDIELQNLAQAASDHIATVLEQPVQNSIRDDYYSGWGARLELSAMSPVADREALAIHYIGSDNTEQEYTGAKFIDDTTVPLTVVLDPVPSHELGKRYAHPIRVSYTTNAGLSVAGAAAVNEAIIRFVADLWNRRPSKEPSQMVKNNIDQLLAPYSRNFGF